MIEPTSSTLLLQPSPSESGSQTTNNTDEYTTYRRLVQQTATAAAGRSKRPPPNASATLCSKSSTSQASTLEAAGPFQLDAWRQMVEQQRPSDSPPPPAPSFSPISHQQQHSSVYGQLNAHRQAAAVSHTLNRNNNNETRSHRRQAADLLQLNKQQLLLLDYQAAVNLISNPLQGSLQSLASAAAAGVGDQFCGLQHQQHHERQPPDTALQVIQL